MTHFIKRVFSMVVIGMSFAAATPALADSPEYVRLRNITYNGTGCPRNTVAGNISQDRQAFTLLFSEYYAEVGPGVPFNQKRKNCQLLLDFDYPRGWSFSILTVDVRGYAALDRGVKATQQTSYYHQGEFKTATLKTVINGEYDANYQLRDVLPLEGQAWSPCSAQRAVNLNTQVILDNSRNSRGRGLITVDSIDTSTTLIYGVRWRRC